MPYHKTYHVNMNDDAGDVGLDRRLSNLGFSLGRHREDNVRHYERAYGREPTGDAVLTDVAGDEVQSLPAYFTFIKSVTGFIGLSKDHKTDDIHPATSVEPPPTDHATVAGP